MLNALCSHNTSHHQTILLARFQQGSSQLDVRQKGLGVDAGKVIVQVFDAELFGFELEFSDQAFFELNELKGLSSLLLFEGFFVKGGTVERKQGNGSIQLIGAETGEQLPSFLDCLLYTSDAADE